MSIISVEALSKCFKVPKKKPGFLGALSSFFSREYVVKKALDAVSFSIEPGEIVGYIGPNGAGKSTTVKILSGILVPDSGSVSVFGKTPWEARRETVRQIGVVFGQRSQLWWDLQVIESFRLLKDIYSVDTLFYKQRLDQLVAALQLEKILSTPVRNLSLGQKMRAEIAAALIPGPKILFLDEPTIGLDAVSKLAVRDFIKTLNEKENVTVMLTTHDMDDIESLAERVILLGSGSIFFDGKLSDLRKKIAPERRLIVDVAAPDTTIYDPDAEVIEKKGHRIWLRYNPNEVMTQKLISRILAKHEVVDLFVENPPVEEIIASLYRKENL